MFESESARSLSALPRRRHDLQMLSLFKVEARSVSAPANSEGRVSVLRTCPRTHSGIQRTRRAHHIAHTLLCFYTALHTHHITHTLLCFYTALRTPFLADLSVDVFQREIPSRLFTGNEIYCTAMYTAPAMYTRHARSIRAQHTDPTAAAKSTVSVQVRRAARTVLTVGYGVLIVLARLQCRYSLG